MNTKSSPIKMRNRYTLTDVYYTYAHWPSKQIDGITFLPVVKNLTEKTIFLLRKDSLEKVK